MGQSVMIRRTVEMGDVLLVDTDRSLTGQDGYAMTPDHPGKAVPGKLAERLFALGLGIDHLFVLQNTFSARRPGGWDEAASAEVLAAAESFLLHYPESETGNGPAEEE